ncbi:MAG TPA: HAD-IB family hydrolase, partial [Capillimicrobium sp.]|nr:HAD-IB family hydrolase [Capillimicrobium sp.]
LRAVGHPVAVNPDAELARVAAAEGWDVMRFETLGRRLKVAAAAVAVAGASLAGRRVVRR